MRQKLTPAFVRDAKPAATNQIFWDLELRGFGLLVLPSGQRRYVVQYRVAGRSTRMTFKPGLTLTDARKEAKAALGAVAKGSNPLAERRRQDGAATNTLRAIAEEYLKREGHKLRSANSRKATFERLVYPVLGARQIDEIRRSEIVRFLDKIEDERGAQMAHKVLALLSTVFNWHASRDDDFRSPIVRGMARVNGKERARSRILTDGEIRAVWNATETHGEAFDRLVQFCLLTGARRSEAALMSRAELSGDGWLLPASRNKTKVDFLRPLSGAARDMFGKLPVIGDGKFVFTGNGRTPVGGFSKRLADLQKLSGTNGWVLHDLRRTARSLMSRAGVNPDVAERCLGHVIPGVRGVYDRHAYYDEKKHAFEELAALIERVVHPPVANVVPLRKEVPA